MDYKGDLYQGIKVLRSGRITMGKKQWSLKKICKKTPNKYALMVNSGSSANLLQPLPRAIQKEKKDLNQETMHYTIIVLADLVVAFSANWIKN